MTKTQDELESELIANLADTLCLAVENLDAETIIRCIRTVLENDVGYHVDRLNKYSALLDSIRPVA